MDVGANGKVLVKLSPNDASWGDLVTGEEELGNAGSPDLGKIQQGANYRPSARFAMSAGSMRISQVLPVSPLMVCLSRQVIRLADGASATHPTWPTKPPPHPVCAEPDLEWCVAPFRLNLHRLPGCDQRRCIQPGLSPPSAQLSLLAGNPLKAGTPLPPAPQPAATAPSISHIANAPLPAEHIAVHYIDVDQGAAALVEFPCGASDDRRRGTHSRFSEGAGQLPKCLLCPKARSHRRLNTIFITHTHIDHNRGLRSVAEAFDVGGYVWNGLETGSGSSPAKWMENPRRRQPKIPTDAVTEGPGLRPRHGWPDGWRHRFGELSRGRSNHQGSLGRVPDQSGLERWRLRQREQPKPRDRIDYGKASFLFTGDMEAPALQTPPRPLWLIRHFARRGLRCRPPWFRQRDNPSPARCGAVPKWP